jgi:putative ABC transport system substrate-binding protein
MGSLKAKTSRSNGAHLGTTSVHLRNMRQSWSRQRVDVIATGGEEAIRAVQQATKTIPIVAIGGDLLGNSLSRPDGNTTGVSILAFEADGKRQDILIEAVPGLRLIAVLADVNVTSTAKLDALHEAAIGGGRRLCRLRTTR